MPGTAHMAQVVRHFDAVSAVLTDGRTSPPTPQSVTSLALDVLGDDAGCSLILTRAGRRPTLAASSDTWVADVAALQLRVGEGPCLDASVGTATIRCDDLAADGRWPRFADRALAECGARSLLSVPLRLSNGDRGALGLYSRTVDRFDDVALGVAAMLAPFAALAMEAALHLEDTAHLETALRTSRQIGIAVGILMARDKVTSEAAFDQLVAASQHLNRKLRDIATEVTQTGQLPPVPENRRD